MMFQHTAARRRLPNHRLKTDRAGIVSTHSRPKAAASVFLEPTFFLISFNTQPPEGGCIIGAKWEEINFVSTHSRPKAAARTQK